MFYLSNNLVPYKEINLIIKKMIDKDEEERQIKMQKERERIAMLNCN